MVISKFMKKTVQLVVTNVPLVNLKTTIVLSVLLTELLLQLVTVLMVIIIFIQKLNVQSVLKYVLLVLIPQITVLLAQET